jgi:hypothetical protein
MPSAKIVVDIGPIRSKVAKQIFSRSFMMVLLFWEVHLETSGNGVCSLKK